MTCPNACCEPVTTTFTRINCFWPTAFWSQSLVSSRMLCNWRALALIIISSAFACTTLAHRSCDLEMKNFNFISQSRAYMRGREMLSLIESVWTSWKSCSKASFLISVYELTITRRRGLMYCDNNASLCRCTQDVYRCLVVGCSVMVSITC